ncbi:transcriptional repressor LexA [Anaerotalea alkaliphila]|uniref:LexA repressor n=1 Tax=Anaerotalea alkaliphila TaxID=2662126 RepID=A0A7X5HWJ3_9FIRM|nr:transcriptional repressor LexA [Anaerotalea alkaliphila]NDL67926.1 transcriptional repressor LexA [Anaerotalea alkaliphila]
MKEEMNDRQRRILEFIKEELWNKGYPPAVREICDAVGLKSTSTVHAHLERLEQLGVIRRDPTKPRAIEITDDSFVPIKREMVNIPIVGRVAAGQPVLAVENIEDYFPLSMDYVKHSNKQLFMVQVKGDSMVDAGMFEGDLLVVEKQEVAADNDIVVALIDDSVTVKTFFREADHIRLQPQNAAMEPIRVKDVAILGKVIGLYRQFA